MSLLITYFVKLSVGLAIVYIFYQLLLRKLTFYNSNRWYLLGYTLLCFLIPFINISPVLEKNEWSQAGIVNWVPLIDPGSSGSVIADVETAPGAWDIISLLVLAGMLIMLVRLLIQFLSFRKMKRNATAMVAGDLRVYQVNGDIIPFSFGNSIFINRELHQPAELQEIIRHEFVHVKQRHSVDIIWAELLCLINWFNPFAWLLRKSIRQNLEFIADHKVLENGVGKKEYQYLLLKVIGNHQYSIATQFNFSSLKKRIAMMNKIRSARVNLLRFLFLLPLLAVILVSFRKQIGDRFGKQQDLQNTSVFTDTVPEIQTVNSKGYYIDIKGKDGECTVVIKDRSRKEITQLPLTDWNKREVYYTDLYGEILPPPPPVPAEAPAPPHSSEMRDFLDRNETVKEVGWVYNRDNTVAILHINKKDGTSERFNLGNDTERHAAENKYGKLPLVSSPVALTLREARIYVPTMDDSYNLVTRVSDDFEITKDKAVIKLKDGKVETYNLTNKKERKDFESKYGNIVSTATTSEAPLIAVGTVLTTAASPVATVKGGVATTTLAPSVVSGHLTATTPVVAISGVPMGAPGEAVTVIDETSYVITGKEDIVITISRNSTRQQLDAAIKQMKTKDIDLTYDAIEYDDKGHLVMISGTMTSKDGSKSRFVASDFEKIILAMVKKEDRTYFKVSTSERKEVI